MTYVHWGLFALLLLLAAGEALSFRYRRAVIVRRTAILLLFLWAWPPSASLFAYTLECWYPVTRFPSGDAEAIVVLGATIYKPDRSQPVPLLEQQAYLRCRRALWLYRNWKSLPIVVSGGPVSAKSDLAVADVMRDALVEWGVPADRIWVERASRSTYENAAFTARILRDRTIHRVALVTEGYHIMRSVLCFRKQKVDVIPAGCDYRYIQFEGNWNQFFPKPSMIGYNEDSLHEWVGLCWYWLSGKI